MTTEKLHAFFALNLVSTTALTLDGISVMFARYLCLTVSFHEAAVDYCTGLTPERLIGQYFGATHVKTFWRRAWMLFLVCLHCQVILLPASLVIGNSMNPFNFSTLPLQGIRFLASKTVQNGVIGRYSDNFSTLTIPWASIISSLLNSVITTDPVKLTVILQVMWTPVICAVQELSWHYSRNKFGNQNNMLMSYHKYTSYVNIFLQCSLGITIYVALFVISLLNGKTRAVIRRMLN
jgi:hypothetical protein